MDQDRAEGRNLRELGSRTRHSSPNIVLITLDAARYDLFVQNLDSLPHFKALAERSVVFDNAFSVGAVTTYAFPGIIAGIYPYHWGAGVSRFTRGIDQVVKESGYNTGFIIEWNPLLSQEFGYGVNADFYLCKFGMVGANASPLPRHTISVQNLAKRLRLGVSSTVIRRIKPLLARSLLGRAAWVCVQRAYSFLRRYAGVGGPKIAQARRSHALFRQHVRDFIDNRFTAPQFLWIHTTVNHRPYVTPANGSAFSDRRTNDLNARRAKVVNYRICQQLKRLYIESLMVADGMVGEILDTLSYKGFLDNSIIVLTADHGEEFMEEGKLFHSVESSSDILLHVPLMISHDGCFQPKHVETPVSTIDIPPTICDLLGIDIPDSFRGISLKPHLCGQTEDCSIDTCSRSRPLFSEGWVRNDMLDRAPGNKTSKRVFTVRKGRYKLKVTQVETAEDRLEEILELADWIDGGRLEPGRHMETIEELRHLLKVHLCEDASLAKRLRQGAERNRIKGAAAKVGDRLRGGAGRSP